MLTPSGELLLSNNVDVNDPSTYGIIQQNIKDKCDQIKQLQDLVNVDTSTFNGNAVSATTCTGNAASASVLAPSDQPQVTGDFNGTNDAVLVFKTGNRGYTWRMRFRGNGVGAEAYLEYLNCDGGWSVGQFNTNNKTPDKVYYDAKGSDNCP